MDPEFDVAFYLYLFAGVLGVIIEGVFCLIRYKHWESHVTTVWGWFNYVYGLGALVLYYMAALIDIQSMFWKVFLMTVIITIIELLAGLAIKYGFGMAAWDYSKQPLNVAGLICPMFSLAWAALALIMCLGWVDVTVWLLPLTLPVPHLIAIILWWVITIDFLLSLVFIFRWSRRHYGKAKPSKLGEWIDKIAPDEWMAKRFMDWRFLK